MNKALQAAHEERERRKAAGIKTKTLNPVEKAKANPRSLKSAIRAFCWTCEGGDADSGVRWRVGNCEITDCPLWPHRPWQTQVGRPAPSIVTAINAENGNDTPGVVK